MQKQIIGKFLLVFLAVIAVLTLTFLFKKEPTPEEIKQEESVAKIYNIDFINVPSESAQKGVPYYYPIKTVISDEGGIEIEAVLQLKLIEAPTWLNLNLDTSILEGIPPAISGEATYKVVLEAEYDESKATKTFYIFLR